MGPNQVNHCFTVQDIVISGLPQKIGKADRAHLIWPNFETYLNLQMGRNLCFILFLMFLRVAPT